MNEWRLSAEHHSLPPSELLEPPYGNSPESAWCLIGVLPCAPPPEQILPTSRHLLRPPPLLLLPPPTSVCSGNAN